MSRQHQFLADHSSSHGSLLPRLRHIMFTLLLLLAVCLPLLN